MKGVQFLTDYQGKKTAALIDLKKHRAFWADVLEEIGEPKDFQFLINEQGEKIAVFLDFSKHEKLWEDIYDAVTTDSKENEPSLPWEEVKRQLRSKDELGV